MKALTFKRYGKSPEIGLVDLPRPTPKADELLVQVHAVGLNPIDNMIPTGMFKPVLHFQLPATLGSDLAGIVVAVGSQVTRFKPGDAVFASIFDLGRGSLAEFAVVPESAAALKPENLNFVQAASIPMVGLTAWHTFFQTTHLTLHEKKVLVIGYGLVGQGVAAAAKAFGGQVMVAEIDPARRLQAAYDGWHVVDLQDAIASADVVATATGAKKVVNSTALDNAKDGVFILNVGHVAEEIDCGYLRHFSHDEVMPYINAYRVGDKTVYLMANGSMLNLTAGFGDSLNAFDVTLAVMASGIHHIVTDGMNAEANV